VVAGRIFSATDWEGLENQRFELCDKGGGALSGVFHPGLGRGAWGTRGGPMARALLSVLRIPAIGPRARVVLIGGLLPSSLARPLQKVSPFSSLLHAPHVDRIGAMQRTR
jgi:hypothetical protein